MLILLLTACSSADDSTPTASDIPLTIIAPSATVNPLVPTMNNPEGGNVGGNDFTPGVSSPTPAPTESTLPMTLVMSDGLVIIGTYYNAPSRPAPTVLLLHMLGSNKESWIEFAPQLQAAGYNVLAVDLRGHGETGGTIDWQKAPDDVVALLNRLRTLSGVDPTRISVIGASIGANLGLIACATTQQCKSIVLLSPGLNYQGVQTSDAITHYGARPILIVASKNDLPSGVDSVTLDKKAQGSHTLHLYDGADHGTAMFPTHADLAPLILQWLAQH